MIKINLVLEAGISAFTRFFLRDQHATKFVSQAFFRVLAQKYSSLGMTYVNSSLDPKQVNSILGREKSRLVILGGSDREWNESDVSELEDNESIQFFIQNLNFPENERFKLLPIGIEDLYWGKAGLPWNFRREFYCSPKKQSVLVGPFRPTDSSRADLIEIAENWGFASVVRGRLASWEYAALASRFRFVACPRGNGLDTHRFWETLARGGVPIVIDSHWARNLKNYFSEVLTLSSWEALPEEIDGLGNISNSSVPRYLTKLFWLHRIESHLL